MSAPNPFTIPELRFRVYSRTDVGRRRKRNEDSLGVTARHGVFVVADGMGGVDGGDYSSRKTVELIAGAFESLEPSEIRFEEKIALLEKTVDAASLNIAGEAMKRGIRGMGTTVVILVFDMEDPGNAAILHAGDSRVYRFRNQDLVALTTDHSMAAESGIGDSTMVPVFMAGVITRAVGVRHSVNLERTDIEVEEWDRFVICSDGLYNMVRRSQICSILQKEPRDPAGELTAAANVSGGFDNITVLVVEPLIEEVEIPLDVGELQDG